MTAVIGMGVLIVAGVIALAVVVTQRMSSSVTPAASVAAPTMPATATLDEPSGTRIVAASVGPDRVALVLSGGGPDRVVMLDARAGRVVGRVGLAR